MATAVLLPLAAASPTAAATAPATSSPYGARASAAQVALQQQVGSTRTVAYLDWSGVEPRPPAKPGGATVADFNFTKPDSAVNRLASGGLETEFRLTACAGPPSRPFWGTVPVPAGVVSPARVCTNMPPRNTADFYNYVYWTVRHYATYVHPVRYFGILNELNDPNQWPGVTGRRQCVVTSTTADCPVLDDYVQMLTVARQAAHAASPTAVILDGAIGSKTWGIAIARSRYESGGKSLTALRDAVSFIDRYYAYRNLPRSGPAWEYINPKLPEAQLRAAFESQAYLPWDPEHAPSSQPQGDRFYYFATHLYRDTSAFDAVQLHLYDGVGLLPDVFSFLRSEMAASGVVRPTDCWECGSMWPMVANADGTASYYQLNVDVLASFTPKRAVTGFGYGLQQFLYLPLAWDAPPTADQAGNSVSPPLVCNAASAVQTLLCPGGSGTLSKIGQAFRELTLEIQRPDTVSAVSGLPAGATGYRFTAATGSVAVLWGPAGIHVDLTRLGRVTGVRDQYGSAVSSAPSAFPLNGTVFYVHLG